jgi:hypothetical protein
MKTGWIWVSVLAATLGCEKATAQQVQRCGAPNPVVANLPPDGPVKMKVVFVAFLEDNNPPLPSWAEDLKVDIPNFMKIMSGTDDSGQPYNNISVEIVKRPGADSTLAWVFPDSAKFYQNWAIFGKTTGNIKLMGSEGHS